MFTVEGRESSNFTQYVSASSNMDWRSGNGLGLQKLREMIIISNLFGKNSCISVWYKYTRAASYLLRLGYW
jgi:hypothetical protein